TQPPTAVITPVSPDPRESPVSAATITFSEPVTGVDVSDFTLQQDNGPNLLTAAQTATTSDGGVTWQLNGLQSLTGSPGQYLLALSGRGSTGIVDAAGNELSPFAIMEVWRVVPPPAPTNLAVYNLGTFNRLVFTDNSVAETAYRWEFHLPGHPQFDWTEGDSFPGNAPGQTGTITFDDVAFAGLSPSYRVWANHFDGT